MTVIRTALTPQPTYTTAQPTNVPTAVTPTSTFGVNPTGTDCYRYPATAPTAQVVETVTYATDPGTCSVDENGTLTFRDNNGNVEYWHSKDWAENRPTGTPNPDEDEDLVNGGIPLSTPQTSETFPGATEVPLSTNCFIIDGTEIEPLEFFANELSLMGYNEEVGALLADYMATHCKSRSSKKCATYVRRCLQHFGLLNQQNESAYQYGQSLSYNTNFELINVTSWEQLLSLPQGCILVYDRGNSGYSSKHGHIEVTTGDGKAISDFKHNIKTPETSRYAELPAYVYIPC